MVVQQSLQSAIIVEDTEFRPGPSQLMKGLDETANRSASVAKRDVLSQGFDAGAQVVVAIDLSAHRQKRLALRDGVELKGVAWDTDRHQGPEVNPSAFFGANGREKGLVA